MSGYEAKKTIGWLNPSDIGIFPTHKKWPQAFLQFLLLENLQEPFLAEAVRGSSVHLMSVCFPCFSHYKGQGPIFLKISVGSTSYSVTVTPMKHDRINCQVLHRSDGIEVGYGGRKGWEGAISTSEKLCQKWTHTRLAYIPGN